jgi:hypothetical protein
MKSFRAALYHACHLADDEGVRRLSITAEKSRTRKLIDYRQLF